MNDYLHRTDTLNPRKVVIVGKQKTHWVEFQLLDELGEPLANMPYRAVSDATRAGCAPECSGHSDAHGVIRLEELYPVDVTLLMSAGPLAEQLQTRTLRAVRPEPPRHGPLGTTLGFTWSFVQLMSSGVFKHSDPFCHHGQIAMFFKAEQHMLQRVPNASAAYNKGAPNEPAFKTVARRLPKSAKLYLVPSLGPVDDQQANQAQERLNGSLDAQSRARFFPPHGNPDTGRLPWIANHYMSQYQPYIHNQLLESINPERDPLLKRQQDRQRFEQQMTAHHGSIPDDERLRNRIFLELQTLIGQALDVTRQGEGGDEALRRFDAIADPQAYYEKTHG